MGRGQKGRQKTTAGTVLFSLLAAGLLVVGCLFAGTLDILFNPKPTISFVGRFDTCNNHLDCPMSDVWVLAPEVTEISPVVEPVGTNLSQGVRICLISPADGNTCLELHFADRVPICIFSSPLNVFCLRNRTKCRSQVRNHKTCACAGN